MNLPKSKPDLVFDWSHRDSSLGKVVAWLLLFTVVTVCFLVVVRVRPVALTSTPPPEHRVWILPQQVSAEPGEGLPTGSPLQSLPFARDLQEVEPQEDRDPAWKIHLGTVPPELEPESVRKNVPYEASYADAQLKLLPFPREREVSTVWPRLHSLRSTLPEPSAEVVAKMKAVPSPAAKEIKPPAGAPPPQPRRSG